jgi:hypothetical protein
MQPRQRIRFTNNAISNNFLDPVRVFPSQTQIANATRTIRYNDIISPINNSCPISLMPFTDGQDVILIRHCGHIFNEEGFNTWFGSNSRCPVCRYDIREYVSPTNTEDVSGSTATTTQVVPATTNMQDALATTTRNIVTQLINNAEINQTDINDLLLLFGGDPSNNYVSVRFDITD